VLQMNNAILPSLGQHINTLVMGATGTLGSAFCAALQAAPNVQRVVQLSRSTSPPIALELEDSLAAAAAHVSNDGPFHCIIDASGALTLRTGGPEKHLGALNAEHLVESFRINTVGPALLIKHFLPLLAPQGRCMYAKLSARVGSIQDNYKGGWYGYRASKAALNMVLQSAAIEASRKRPQLIIAAMQPGTVASPLSTRFAAPEHCISAQASVQGLLQTLDGLTATGRAHFVDYRGNTIAW
jgi:NAD(P)-dependent dehydrogenase (short-subunit alcohol dehydrogenase family)